MLSRSLIDQKDPDGDDSGIPPGGAKVGDWAFPFPFVDPVPDASGQGNDLVLMVGAPTTQNLDGRIGLEFTTVDDQLQAGPSATISTPINGQSLSAWYYGNSVGQGPLISRYDTVGVSVWRVASNVVDAINVLDRSGYVGGSADNFGATFNAAAWNHLAVVFDTDNSEMRVYVNNAAPIIRTLDISGFFEPSVLIVGDITGSFPSETTPVGVIISDVRLFNYALTADQVDAIYNG